MPTGHTVVATCTARAALAGNPSDGYGGAVLAVPIPDLMATVAATEAAMTSIRTEDDDLRALLGAALDGYRETIGTVPDVEVSASTTIPRSVGLAGSSALVIATLRALAGWSGHRWDRRELAELALSVERDRLGIAAGLQDRLVQAVAHPVLMRFDPVSFETIELPDDLPLFVAWSTEAAEPSGTVHRSLRRRYDGGDERVVTAMRELAVQARRAHRGLADGDVMVLADAMDRSFDLRDSIVDVGERQRRLVEIGRTGGAAVNSAGSGGSVVGLAPDAATRNRIIEAYRVDGCDAIALG